MYWYVLVMFLVTDSQILIESQPLFSSSGASQATKPLNAFLVSCWRGVLSDTLQGNFLVEVRSVRSFAIFVGWASSEYCVFEEESC